MTDPLLDPPPVTAARLEQLEATVALLLETRLQVLLAPAEAILPLEAAARSLGRSGVTALNLETRPYGVLFGRWLREAGATVIGIEPEPHRAVAPDAVERALGKNPTVSVLSFVHVEAASGIRNDAAAMTALAREHGALIAVDLVASLGAEEVRLDDWGADIAVVGPQKALAGPAGISVAAVSDRAWQAMTDNPGAPRGSSLSLLGLRDPPNGSVKGSIPQSPAPLELLALEAALARVADEGLQQVRRRHAASAAASRAGARVLGLAPLAREAEAAAVVTTLAAPAGLEASALVERARSGREVAVSAGFGELANSVVRIDHTGQRARLGVVLEALEAIGNVLERANLLRGPVREALDAAEAAWETATTPR